MLIIKAFFPGGWHWGLCLNSHDMFFCGDFEGRRESLSPPGSVQVRGLSGSDTLSEANLNEETDLLYFEVDHIMLVLNKCFFTLYYCS